MRCFKYGEKNMKPLITWITIGACLLLFGCSEQQKTQANMQHLTVTPQVTYGTRVNALYNESFVFSPGEDLQLFQAKVNGYVIEREMNRTRLDGQTIMRAIGQISDVDGCSRKRTKLLAEVLRQTEHSKL
jgi:hypothetical protein